MTHPTDSRKKRIFIMDDYPLVREWLTNLINLQPDLEVCGEADNRPKALKLIRAAKPDIAVVDLYLAGGLGIDLIKDLKAAAPEVAVVVLTVREEPRYAQRALHAGARGYIVKREATKQVLAGIRSVLAGKSYVSDTVRWKWTQGAAEGQPGAKDSPLEVLSTREFEVFELLGCGFDTRRIGDKLGVSFKTVQSFCARIKDKLKLRNANELLCEAIRWHESQEAR